MTDNNNSSDNWKSLQGSAQASFGVNKEAPEVPKSMSKKTIEILNKNGADVQLVDEEKLIAKIDGEIKEDMVKDLIISFFGHEYWDDVKNQDNLVKILLGAFGFFDMEAAFVEQKGDLKKIKIRGTAKLETKEGI